MKYIYFIFLLTCVAGCKNNGGNSSEGTNPLVQNFPAETTTKMISTYADGTYCAQVEHHNTTHRTTRTYASYVEIRNNELIQINWPKGGWKDDSRFSAAKLDDSGCATLVSAKGHNYIVTINNDGPCAVESTKAREDQLRREPYAKEVEGYVIWAQSGCKYVMINIGGLYVVANRSYAFLSNGDHVRGNLAKIGYQHLYNISNNEEERIYIDNYYGSKTHAIERIKEKCNQLSKEGK